MKKIFVLIILGLILIGCGGGYPEKQWFHVRCHSESGSVIFDEDVLRDIYGDYYVNGNLVYINFNNCLYTEIDEPQ